MQESPRPTPAHRCPSATTVFHAARRSRGRRRRRLPAHIGKYRILGRLGDGATSEVFLGYDDFQRRNVAIKRRARRRPPATRSTATTRSASSPPRPRWSAGCSTRTWSRSSTPCPTRWRPTWSWSTWPAARCAPYCRADQLLLARAGRRDRLQVRDGARLRLPPGPDPPRRQAGQPAGRAHQRQDHRRQDQRLRQRAEPRLRRARRSTASARSPTCRPSSSTAARSTAAPTSTRSAPCSTTSSPAGRSFDAQVQSAHDASDLQRQAGRR